MARPNRRRQKRAMDPSIGTGELRRRQRVAEVHRREEFEGRVALVTVRCTGARVVAILRPRAVEDFYPVLQRVDVGRERQGVWHGRALKDGALIMSTTGSAGAGGAPTRTYWHTVDGNEGLLVTCPVHGEHLLDPELLQERVERAEQLGRTLGNTPVEDVLLR